MNADDTGPPPGHDPPPRDAGRRRRGLRTAAGLTLFGVVAALEVDDGLDRLAEARSRRRSELLDLLDGQQEALGREVSGLIGDGRRHAVHLSRHPMVRELLGPDHTEEGPSDGARDALAEVLRPYLATFAEIDRVRVLDPHARERFRGERMGGAVATLPPDLLDRDPAAELVALAPRIGDHGVAVSALTYDAERVEVEAADRRVFHLVAPIEDVGADGRPVVRGAVAVTVYAAPLLRALKAFAPLPGTRTVLLDASGDEFAPGRRRPGEGSSGLELAAAVRDAVRSGEREITSDELVHLARSIDADPAAYVVSSVPQAVFEQDLWAGEGVRTAARTLVVLVAIGIGTAFFVRAGQRSARLEEAERYARRIREESGKQRALMDAAADIILIVAPDDDTLEDWNPRASELFGLERDARPSFRSITEALAAAGGPRLEAAVAEACESDEPVVAPGLSLARGSDLRDLDARCVRIEYDGRRLVEVALSDRTRERAMELRARTAERLSALGLLTAGVAHEINNPLEGISNYLELAGRTGDDAKRASYLAQVRRGFERIREITGELLPLSRPVADDGAADLARVVDRAVSMARFSRDLREVRVDVDVPSALVVPGSEGSLEQVVLNLLLNGGRAMNGAGSLRVSARRVDSAHVELVVDDDGPGVPDADQSRVFDPFFTTSDGNGLGLAVSYQIAQAHGGELSVTNRPEGGARFVLSLPTEAEEVDE